MRRVLWISTLLVLVGSFSVGSQVGFVNPATGRIVLEQLGQPVTGLIFTVGCAEQFRVSINAVNMPKIAGFQMELRFTKGMMEVLSVDYGNLDFETRWASAYNMDPAVDNPGGRVTKIASVRIDGGLIMGTGRLLTVNFRALRPGIARIGLERVFISDCEGRQTSIRVRDAIIRIDKWPPWDVNRDGQVDVSDFVCVARCYGNPCSPIVPSNPIVPDNPDVNRDGVVNLLDLILVAKHFGEVYGPNLASRRASPKRLRILSLQERLILVQLERALAGGDGHDLALRALGGILKRARSDVELSTWGRLRKGV